MIPKRLLEKLSLHARNVLRNAGDIAKSARADSVEPEHMLLAVLREDGSFGNIFLGNAGLTRISATKGASDGSGRRKGGLPISQDGKAILAQTYLIASDFRSPYVGTEHIAYALLENPDRRLEAIFAEAGIDPDKTLDALEAQLEPEHLPGFGKLFDLPDVSIAGPDEESKDDLPFLSQYAVDLGYESERRDEAFFGRDTEIERVIRILGRKEKNNPLLLGDPGVGKTAIVTALARRLRDGSVPDALAGKRILALDLALVISGTSFRGEFEARIKDILHEVKEHPEIILFVDELHTIVGAGNTQGGLDAANILKPALARGEIRMIGATTPSEYKKHVEKDPALARRFQPVSVREPSPDETCDLLRRIRSSYEKFHGVSIGNDLVDLSVSLSVRHMHDRFLPDKAIDILDEASSLAKSRRGTDHAGRAAAAVEHALRNLREEKESLVRDNRLDEAAALLDDEEQLRREQRRLERRSSTGSATPKVTLDRRDILETVSSMSGIPFSALERETPTERLSRLGDRLRKSVTNQEEAVSAVESTLVRAVSGVRDPGKPLGSFLFLGPTGVGKTLLAKAVAEHYFGGEDRLIRMDMSEFMERHSVAQMIGAPAGYVGFGEGGKLTERVRRTPHAVVLFDEVEKAHPDVWNILLQVLDEGFLTDSEGTRVSFRNTLVILTSNLGTDRFRGSGRIGFSGPGGPKEKIPMELREAVLKETGKTLRPELLARIGETVVFNPLGPKAMERVVRLELDALRQRLGRQGVSLSAGTDVVRFLAKRSVSSEHGARLVRRTVEELVSLPIARTLIGHGFDPESSDSKIRVRCVADGDAVSCSVS